MPDQQVAAVALVNKVSTPLASMASMLTKTEVGVKEEGYDPNLSESDNDVNEIK